MNESKGESIKKMTLVLTAEWDTEDGGDWTFEEIRDYLYWRINDGKCIYFEIEEAGK